MPDILIRGMEMPGSCAACDFYNVISGRCTRTGTKINFSELTTRSVDCPISELPPHGDLVDATQYRDEFMDGVYNMCADDSDNNRANAIIDLYDCAPVIVPAERRKSGE